MTTTAPKTGLRAQPEFETMEDETIVADTSVMDAALAIAKAAADAAPANVPVVAATNTAVGTPSKFYAAFSDKEEAIAIAQVEQWKMAAPAITGENGAAKHSVLGPLGQKIRLNVESYNLRYMAVPGSNDKEAKDKCRDSYDKETLSGDGTSLQGYIESLKAMGYDKARLETYVDLWGYLTRSDKYGDIDEDDQELVRVQLSKTSAANFGYFCGQRGRKESAGKVPKLTVVEIIAVGQTGSAGSYTNFSFAAPKG